MGNKESKDANSNMHDHTHYFALVALVAVVAVVSLVLSVGTPSSSGDLTGNAFKLPFFPAEEQKQYYSTSPTPLPSAEEEAIPDEETTEEEPELAPVEEGIKSCNPVFINQAELIRRFGTGNVDYSASEWCAYLGYNGCVAGQMKERIQYFDSTNGSCQNTGTTANMKPLTPLDNVDNYLVNCGRRAGDDIRGIPQGGSCYGYVGTNTQDTMITRSLNGVLCCS